MISIAIEIILILLLVITICYCFVLDQRLKVLRNGHSDLRKVIIDLSQTTHVAQEAISGLKATANDVDQQLSEKLNAARAMTTQLGQAVEEKPVPETKEAPAGTPQHVGKSIFLSKSG